MCIFSKTILVVPQDWPGLGDPALSKTNSEPWEMRSLTQTFIDLKHLEPSPPYKIVHIEEKDKAFDKAFNSKQYSYIDSTSVKKYSSFKTISVLKIDVEGAEWDSLAGEL